MLYKKRNRLIEEIGKGSFVPNSTINAFLLYYNSIAADGTVSSDENIGDNWNYWTSIDADKYEEYIVHCLKAVEHNS